MLCRKHGCAWRDPTPRFAQGAASSRPVLVNGAPGVLAATPDGRPMSIMVFTVVDGRIVEINSIADPERLARLDLRIET